MAVLRITSGEHTGKIHSLEDDRVVLGRDGTLALDDQGVSRQHAEVFRIGELYFIQDLKSRNGTFVNEHRIEDQELLRNGDRIHLGNTVLVFEDSYARPNDSRVITFGDSVDRPGSTIAFQPPPRPGARAPTARDGESSRLQVLYRVSRHLGTGEDSATVLRNVAREMSEALNADHVYLFAYGPKGTPEEEEFRLVADHDRAPATEIAVSRSILRRVRDETRPVLSSDALLDDRFATAQSIVMKQLKSILCVPLVVMNHPIGAFYATNTKVSEAFSAEDLELATTIGMLVGNAFEMWQVIEKQGLFYRRVLKIIAAAAEMRTPRWRGRAERVATCAAAMARSLSLDDEQTRALWIGGLLHDIGAIALTEDEIQKAINLEQRKARLAKDLLEQLPELQDVAPMILLHSERLDGSGFPQGLSGNAISREAQIIGLAVEFERLLSQGGPDGGELSTKEALIQARDQSGKRFSAEVVNALLIAYRRGTLFKADSQLPGLGL